MASARNPYSMLGFAFGMMLLAGCGNRNTIEVEVTDYQPPADTGENGSRTAAADEALADDQLDDITPPDFDPELIDRRPWQDWLVNSSAAVIKLDVPLIKPDREPELLTLHPSYAAAVDAMRSHDLLPSVNLIDGKAKQFDDGLYAALDQAYYQGLERRLESHVELVRRLRDALVDGTPAQQWLTAALLLADADADTARAPVEVQRLLADFLADETCSKPIGFYTWSDTLRRCFRFLRFLQKEFGPEPAAELQIPRALAAALATDAELMADYRRAIDFYGRLTNPHICLSVADLAASGAAKGGDLHALAKKKHASHESVALFPPATSRETVLFDKLFPSGLPPKANLMRELISRIRSGEVDLRPADDSGWYDYQVYALETLLLPGRGPEKSKLLLTRAYKQRMQEAFAALITKRRETHVRNVATTEYKSERPLPGLKPRLRLEPAPSYYLRTARAYAFLADFLGEAIGQEALGELHGLTKDGLRPKSLADELPWMRDLFFGCYLVSAEDIGLRADIEHGGSPVDSAWADDTERQRCYSLAEEWLVRAFGDPDLAEDTRVAVPLYIDRQRNVTRLWLTLGVRLCRLSADYSVPPRIKPAEGTGDWQPADSAEASYLIAVDEFAEVELKGLRVLNREELRAVADEHKTKDAIVRALQR
jgi:hypothetical protein